MVKKNHVLFNPPVKLTSENEQRLPRVVLNALEVDQILNVIDLSRGMGVRDRAILETLYSTGIRRLDLPISNPLILMRLKGLYLSEKEKGERTG